MQGFFRALAAAVAACWLVSCTGVAPATFRSATTSSSRWVAIQLREDHGYEAAWRDVFDIVAREFDLALFSREEGFIQTAWNAAGAGTGAYQTRVKLRFSKDRRTVYLSCEGRFLSGGTWHVGIDKQLQDNLKSDLQGVLGRTIR